MKIGLFLLLLLGNMLGLIPAHAHDNDHHASPSSHAPIGVMAEHIHKKGEVMLSYRYSNMHMNQHYAGSDKIDIADVHRDYMIAPTGMTMEMHMLGGMYGLTDEVTLMAMLPYMFKSMDHSRRTDGRTFNTRTEGLGDIKLTGMFSLERFFNEKIQLNLGVSLPTGTVSARGTTLAGSEQKFPYPMQLGSGTFDFLPGVTYSGRSDEFSWGAQVSGVLRNGRNDESYRLGHQLNVTSWLAYEWLDWMNSSVRLNLTKWGNITESDPELNPAMVQTADPENHAGERLDVFVGTNIVIPKGALRDHRLALEVGFPAYIHLEGPQLATDLQFTVGWQKQF